MKKRILSLVLACIMLLGMLPAYAVDGAGADEPAAVSVTAQETEAPAANEPAAPSLTTETESPPTQETETPSQTTRTEGSITLESEPAVTYEVTLPTGDGYTAAAEEG